MSDTLFQQLTPSQRKAVFHVEGPLLVLAGPGSGKTRVITYRIAALIESKVMPHNICAITFTNKAAEQMRQRAIALGASAGAHISTFHSLCVRILRRYAAGAGVNPNFSIYDESEQAGCIRQAVKDCGLDATGFPPARMLDAISTLKNRLIDADSFGAGADDFFSKTLAKIYARYQHILAERNGLDFDDLLVRTAHLLEDCPDICSEIGNRFKFLLIDEYQDTNHAQYKIARSLVSAHNNICATGDPDQSIYRWRGADIRNILAFENDWPDAVVVRLEENFRSAAGILEVADKLISFNRNRKQKKLIPTKPPGPAVSVTVFADEIEEADAVAQQVGRLAQEGVGLKDVAVFYRVNAASRVLEEAFIKNKIPYQIVRGVEFYGRKEIRDLLAYLKILVNPADETALLRIINTPARGVGKTTIDRLRSYAALHNIGLYDCLKRADNIESLVAGAKAKIAAFVNMIEQLKKDISGRVAPLAARVFGKTGMEKSLQEAGPEGQNAVDNVNELINAAAQYDRQAREPSLLDYLQQISLFSDVDSYDVTCERVALMTLHCAKGLEFENVFIVGLEDGLLPHERSNTEDEDDLEEERRLFFVGITRAKTGLYISCARYRTTRGQMLRTIPSQFLYELGIGFTPPVSFCHSHDLSAIASATAESGNQYCYDATGDDGQIIPDFAAGQLVRHKTFGLGRVREFVDMGEDSIVVVRFNTGQTKSLMLKYAGLLKL